MEQRTKKDGWLFSAADQKAINAQVMKLVDERRRHLAHHMSHKRQQFNGKGVFSSGVNATRTQTMLRVALSKRVNVADIERRVLDQYLTSGGTQGFNVVEKKKTVSKPWHLMTPAERIDRRIKMYLGGRDPFDPSEIEELPPDVPDEEHTRVLEATVSSLAGFVEPDEWKSSEKADSFLSMQTEKDQTVEVDNPKGKRTKGKGSERDKRELSPRTRVLYSTSERLEKKFEAKYRGRSPVKRAGSPSRAGSEEDESGKYDLDGMKARGVDDIGRTGEDGFVGRNVDADDDDDYDPGDAEVTRVLQFQSSSLGTEASEKGSPMTIHDFSVSDSSKKEDTVRESHSRGSSVFTPLHSIPSSSSSSMRGSAKRAGGSRSAGPLRQSGSRLRAKKGAALFQVSYVPPSSLVEKRAGKNPLLDASPDWRQRRATTSMGIRSERVKSSLSSSSQTPVDSRPLPPIHPTSASSLEVRPSSSLLLSSGEMKPSSHFVGRSHDSGKGMHRKSRSRKTRGITGSSKLVAGDGEEEPNDDDCEDDEDIDSDEEQLATLERLIVFFCHEMERRRIMQPNLDAQTAFHELVRLLRVESQLEGSERRRRSWTKGAEIMMSWDVSGMEGAFVSFQKAHLESLADYFVRLELLIREIAIEKRQRGSHLTSSDVKKLEHLDDKLTIIETYVGLMEPQSRKLFESSLRNSVRQSIESRHFITQTRVPQKEILSDKETKAMTKKSDITKKMPDAEDKAGQKSPDADTKGSPSAGGVGEGEGISEIIGTEKSKSEVIEALKVEISTGHLFDTFAPRRRLRDMLDYMYHDDWHKQYEAMRARINLRQRNLEAQFTRYLPPPEEDRGMKSGPVTTTVSGEESLVRSIVGRKDDEIDDEELKEVALVEVQKLSSGKGVRPSHTKRRPVGHSRSHGRVSSGSRSSIPSAGESWDLSLDLRSSEHRYLDKIDAGRPGSKGRNEGEGERKEEPEEEEEEEEEKEEENLSHSARLRKIVDGEQFGRYVVELEHIWTTLHTPSDVKLVLLSKYNHISFAETIVRAHQLWSEVQKAIIAREEVLDKLGKLEVQASDPRRHRAGSSVDRLEEERMRAVIYSDLSKYGQRCERFIKALYREFGDRVAYNGVEYMAKMKNDYSRLLYELERERIQNLRKSTLIGTKDPKRSVEGGGTGRTQGITPSSTMKH
eukprot:TRINITY_DN4473_c0_g1_i3.p1 TRINITY_DN4473_c0_g1~~TRINITY_DN4473_c0_g1_i3.p1  ORF type:complete len:1178 (+),score=374.17 TRINITY_DN4473_c0_g1_i3:158-3691(+)